MFCGRKKLQTTISSLQHPKIAGRHCGLYNGRYTAIEVDLWSFGATLFSVATNRIPFNVQSEMEYFKCVSKKPKGNTFLFFHSIRLVTKYSRSNLF